MRSLLRPMTVLALVWSVFVSCKKQTDTAPDPTAILVGKTWQVDELRYVQLNKSYYYKRGNTANNVNYDDAVIKFNADGTGMTRWQGNSYALNWYFDSTKTKITYTLSSGASIIWDNLTFSESMITYTEYYSMGGVVSQAYGVRTRQL